MTVKRQKPYHYTALKEPVPITEQVWPEGTLPLVHTRTMTYMHENYIRECIEGILMQKTTFPVRVLIHDDASSDKTAEIVREYEMQYPTLIKAYFQTVNSHSQKNAEVKKRLRAPFNEMRIGKYEALCEGDDYWIDPLKLQKQVIFLEDHSEYGFVHGDCHKYYHEEGRWQYHVNTSKTNRMEHASKEELFYGLINFDYKVRTATVLYRYELMSKIDKKRKVFPMGDTPKWLEFSQHTRFKYLDEVFAVYRVLKNSMSKSTDKKKYFRFKLAMMEMRVYYCKVLGYDVKHELKKAYNKALLNYKLLDPAFEPEFALLDPTFWQYWKIKCMKRPIFHSFFILEDRINAYLKKILRLAGLAE
jgi:glycosyltransferase involved in cell wall biosynthesis